MSSSRPSFEEREVYGTERAYLFFTCTLQEQGSWRWSCLYVGGRLFVDNIWSMTEIRKVIDPKYYCWFPYESFNQIQQQSLPSILESDENILISAPTGSGKTALFELAMIRLFETQPIKKIVYLSPMRALCTEKYTLWSEKLSSIGKSCIELIGGDNNNFTKEQVEGADLYITTPEKWDYMTRSSNFIDSIGLVLIDEVHILNEQRGAVLEAIISRMRVILADKPYRIMAVSATIPNTENLANWLRCHKSGKPAKILKFPDSMRPVLLKTHVVAVPMNGKNGFTFDFSLNYKLTDIITKYSENKPTLIFCSTRKSTIKTAEFLATNSPEINQVELPVQLEDKHLQELIYKYKLAYHHAGLSSNDREIVETLFKQNRIRVLCSTSTLAIGVNLPAHLVIIKSTLQYTSETGYTEYSELDLRQMIGRAGRAGYDSQGIAVIITSTETEYLYKTISEGKLEIDSKLLFGFIEFLNIEISNGNINSFSEAMKWLSFTFLHTRMKQNPSKYSLKPSEPIDQQIKNSMNLYLDELVSCGVIERRGEEIVSTVIGQAMAHNFITLKTLKHLIKSDFTGLSEIVDLLRLLSQSPDLLTQIPFHGTDKALLHKISTCPRLIYPLKGKVDWETWKKPFLLAQIALQSELVQFESKLTPSQRSDQQIIIDNFCRILKFIAEVAVQNESHGLLLRNSLEFLSSLKGRSWHSNSNLLQQIPGIGQVGSNSLFNAGIRSIDAIRSADDSRLEILLKRNPPFGRNIKKSINESFPSVNFNCELKNRIIKMSLSLKSKISTSTICFQGKYAHLLVIAYTNSSTCRTLLYDQIPLNILDKTVLNRTVNIENCTIESSFSCSFMFEDWSGLNQNICFDIENLKLDVKETVADLKETLNISSVSEIDLPSDFDFEDNLHFDSSVTLSSRHKDPHPNIPLSPLSTKSQTPSKPIPIITNSSCKHNCKDKFNCAHVCCKAGLLKRPAEIALTPPPQSLKKKSSFLSGAKRSLSNAREYLRKYQPVNITSGQSIISNLQPCTQDKSDLYDEIEIALRSIE